MTDDEINRKFELVANHMASFFVGLEQLGDKVNALGEKVDSLAEAQRRTEGNIQALLTIAEIQSEEIKIQSEGLKQLGESVKIIDGRQRQTDERLNVLIDLFEKDISERRNGRKKAEGNGDEQAEK